MTQNELAEALGVTQTSVSQWEGGRNYPDIKTAKRLATMFGATLDQILGMEDMSDRPLVDSYVPGALFADAANNLSHDDVALLEQKSRLLFLMDNLSPLARQRILDRAEIYYEIEGYEQNSTLAEESGEGEIRY